MTADKITKIIIDMKAQIRELQEENKQLRDIIDKRGGK